MSSPEGADVITADGQLLGQTPLTMRRPQTPGATLTFIVRRQGFLDAPTVLTLAHDDVKDVALSRRPAPRPARVHHMDGADAPLNPFEQ
jgi:hypothetical protein